MPIAPTTLAPTTAAQGQQVVISGTGMDTTRNVLVGGVPATIVGTPTPTAVVFIVPAGATIATGVLVRLLDATTGDVAVTGGLTVTAAPSNGTLVSTTAKKWRLDVLNVSSWLWVRGISSAPVGTVSTNKVDDSDFDSGFWGSTTKVSGTWAMNFTAWRKRDASVFTYDPGQELIRAQQDLVPGTVTVRWYDRTGGPEAYTGTGSVEWTENAGGNGDLSSAAVVIDGSGARIPIANPVLADPTLRGGF